MLISKPTLTKYNLENKIMPDVFSEYLSDCRGCREDTVIDRCTHWWFCSYSADRNRREFEGCAMISPS